MTSFSNHHPQSDDESMFIVLQSINGTMVNYYHVCPRKLWLYTRGMGREQDSPLVELGKLLHDQSFTRRKHDLSIFGRIKIDYTTAGEVLIIHEVKKTKSQFHATRAQALFYLYAMEQLGVECRGEVHYRSEKRRESIELDNESRVKTKESIQAILAVVSEVSPPPVPTGVPCSKCAYKDYCRM